MATPVHCRPQAYDAFRAAVPILESEVGLIEAAVAIAMHELPTAAASDVVQRIDALAADIETRVRGCQRQARLAHAHVVLFDELGFRGDSDDYLHSRSSYLPATIVTRRGLPITLVLLYKLVLARLDVPVLGISAPGHFLAWVDGDGAPMIVDPFAGGAVLTKEDAFRRIEQVTGSRVPRSDELLRPASHRQWIARMLRNLQACFTRTTRVADVGAMLELAALLEADDDASV